MNKHVYTSIQSSSIEKEEIEQGKSYMLIIFTILAVVEMVNAAAKWWW